MVDKRQRAYDATVIGRFWHESKMWVHLCILAIGAALAWQTFAQDIETNTVNIRENSDSIKILTQAMAQQAIISGRIEQKVDYIREDVSVMKRKQ